MSPQPDLSKWLPNAQVCAQLGISPRTLDTWVTADRLHPQYRKRTGLRSERVFDPEEIAAQLPPPRTSVVRSPESIPQLAQPSAQISQSVAESAQTGLEALVAQVAGQLMQQLLPALLPAPEPPPDPMYIHLKRAAEITGISEGGLRRLIKAKNLSAIQDVFTKVRGESLLDMDVSALEVKPPAKPKRGKR